MGTLPISRGEVDKLTALVIDALGRLGLAHVCKDGRMQPVIVKRRLVTESGGLLLLEIDTARLPRGVNAGELIAERTLHHLAAVVHHPVRALNTTGVTLAVLLDHAAGRATLPQLAELARALPTWDGRPCAFPLGLGPAGPVWERLRGHYLVGGETGSGKTTFLLSMGLALAQTTAPGELRMVIVDPKAVDLWPLAGLPHAAGRPVASDPQDAAQVLAEQVAEIERRQRAFLRLGARDLDGYNVKAGPGDQLPRVLLVIDEVTELALTLGLKSPFYRDLIRLACQGRAFGLTMVLATQNPKAEVLNTLIRGNLAGRIAFRVTTPEHSRVILGEYGAERLPRIAGRLLARLGDGRMHALQGYAPAAADIDRLAAVAPLAPAGDDGAAGDSRPELLLSGPEVAMLRYGLAELAGRFGQREIMAGGWPRREYRALVGKLEALGLVHKDPAQGNALYLDADLLQPALDRLDRFDGLDGVTP